MAVKVSVIIPVYNEQDYLRECLQSLKNQDFVDCEFICVDDGSTDGSLSICKLFATSDERFKVISQKNAGPAVARNAGMDLAQGEYICFVDSDDRVKSNMLTRLYSEAKSGDFDIVVHGADTFGDGEPEKYISDAINVSNHTIMDFTVEDIFMEKGCRPFLWQHFIRASIIKGWPNKINADLKIGEDQAFEIRYFSYARKVRFIEDRLYEYRINKKGSITEWYSHHLMDKLWQHDKMIFTVQVEINPDVIDDEAKLVLMQWGLDMMYWDMIKLLYRDQVPYARELMKFLNNYGAERLNGRFDRIHTTMYEQMVLMDEYGDKPEELIAEERKVLDCCIKELDGVTKGFNFKFRKKAGHIIYAVKKKLKQ